MRSGCSRIAAKPSSYPPIRCWVPKVRDIVGLYVNPPEHAVVLCVDEKSQIQALDRAAAADAARQARAADARLQAPWHHLAVCRARRQERQSDRPDASPPSVHRVPQVPGPHRRQRARRSRCPPHPGQLRNAQNTAHPGVVRQASPVSRALHTHLWLVAEPRGALVRGTDDEADPAWGASQCKRVGARHRGVSRCAQHRSPTLCLDQVRGSDPGEYRALRTMHHGHPSRTTYLTNHCYRTLVRMEHRRLERSLIMTRWQPDPTFYPSPRMAMQAPAEKLGYVAILN